MIPVPHKAVPVAKSKVNGAKSKSGAKNNIRTPTITVPKHSPSQAISAATAPIIISTPQIMKIRPNILFFINSLCVEMAKFNLYLGSRSCSLTVVYCAGTLSLVLPDETPALTY